VNAGDAKPPRRRVARPWHHYLRSALFLVVFATSLLPRRARRSLARLTARFVYVLAPRLRRRIEKNLTRVLGGDVAPGRLRASVVAVLVNYGDYVLDFLALLRGDPQRWRGATTGEDGLQRARTAGRGVLLATAHLGSWEMAALFLSQRMTSVTLVSLPEEIGWLGRLRSRIRNSRSHKEVLLGDDPMAVIELMTRLRAGEFVGVQLDRVAGGGAATVPFCGHRLFMPRGPARLAHATGAWILPVFAFTGPDGRYDLIIEEPIDPEGLDEAAIQAKLAGLLETHVRRHPEQWLMMQDPWNDAAATDREGAVAAANGGRR
jgi:KDO2-lipid IV(A) lauroyltransferase